MKLFRPSLLKNLSTKSIRFYATTKGTQIRFHEFGDPKKVLKMEEFDIPEVKDNQVLVKMLQAPINPADINMIQGNYGIKPELPSIAGNEGVGVVEKVGPNVKNLKPGQRVIPAQAGFGTWRTHAVASEDDFLPIAEDIPLEYAATISVNPCTAFRLLHDFVKLEKGDVVIQNGATSQVGHAVIGIASAMGCTTVNIIRERPFLEDTIEKLKMLGGQGTIVVTDTYAKTPNFTRLMYDLPRPKLALNCVGGEAARIVSKWLGDRGVMVTYGGMSKQPITMATSPFIFKDITLKGFWMSRWIKEHSREERMEMLDRVAALIKKDYLKQFIELHRFSQFNNAFETATLPQYDRKVVLQLQE